MSKNLRQRTVTVLLLVIAVIHLLPLSGFFGGAQLAALYGIEVGDPNLEVLMRHRAVLFAILGSIVAYAAFRPATQPLALIASFVSIASFFYLAYAVGDLNAAIRKVVVTDVVAAVAWAGAVTFYWIEACD